MNMVSIGIFSLNFTIVAAAFSIGLLYYLSKKHELNNAKNLAMISALGIAGSFLITLLSGAFVHSALGRWLARNYANQMYLDYLPEVFIWPQILALTFGAGVILWIENNDKQLLQTDKPFKKLLSKYTGFLILSFIANIVIILLITSFV